MTDQDNQSIHGRRSMTEDRLRAAHRMPYNPAFAIDSLQGNSNRWASLDWRPLKTRHPDSASGWRAGAAQIAILAIRETNYYDMMDLSNPDHARRRSMSQPFRTQHRRHHE